MQKRGIMIKELTGIYGTVSKENVIRASQFIVLTGNDDVDYMSIIALENLRVNVAKGISTDLLKYSLPECFKVRLQTQFNGRSLQNFLRLRSDKSALWEIRNLATAIYTALPEEHKYLYEDCMYDLVEKKKQIANEAYQKALTIAQIDVDQDQ